VFKIHKNGWTSRAEAQQKHEKRKNQVVDVGGSKITPKDEILGATFTPIVDPRLHATLPGLRVAVFLGLSSH